MPTLRNLLRQHLDIAGSKNHAANLSLTDEPSSLGTPVAGQTGVVASIVVGVSVVVSGLTGMTTNSVGRFLEISGANTIGNNGTFRILSFINATSVTIENLSGATDANNGSIHWVERLPYTLETDLNYIRTDRAAIKGVGYSQAIPTYIRDSDTTQLIPANLANIAGKTTDATSLLYYIRSIDIPVTTGDTYILYESPGNLPYAYAVDLTGIPVSDGYDSGNDNATEAVIVDDSNGAALRVLAGAYAGQLIYGRIRGGISGVDGDSFEVEFRSVDDGYDLSTSVAYTWEATQSDSIGLFYPYRERIDRLPEYAFKPPVSSGGTSTSVVGGDLSGSLPNPSVVDLTITGQQWGSVLFHDGLSWVAMGPGTDGYVLTTHDTFADPTWTEPPGASGGITANQHSALRQLIHLADGVGGPFEGFVSGTYREILPAEDPFPTQVIWWDSAAKNKKIVEKVLTRNGQQLPTTTQWKVYNSGGAVEATVTDTITYSGVFEVNRTRTVS